MSTKISELCFWEENYRIGDIEAIKRSFAEFGFNGVLRIWNNTVMAGNQQLRALVEKKRESLENVLVPLTTDQNEKLLSAAGFRHHECFWRWMNFCGWIAIKEVKT